MGARDALERTSTGQLDHIMTPLHAISTGKAAFWAYSPNEVAVQKPYPLSHTVLAAYTLHSPLTVHTNASKAAGTTLT